MKKIVCLVAILFLLSLTMHAFALECTVSYDTTTNAITLSGVAKAPVSVMVLSDGSDPSGIAEEVAVGAMQYDWRGVTEFNETILLNKNLPSGTYDVILRSNEQYMVQNTETQNGTPVRIYGVITDNIKEVKEEIYHINVDDGAQLVADLNSVKADADSLYVMISGGKTGEDSDPEDSRVPYTELLGVESDGFATYGEYVAKQMVGTKDGEAFANTDEAIALVHEYRVLYEAINSSDASAVISANAEVYDVDVARFVDELDKASVTKLNALLKKFEADGRSLSEELPELSALATVQAADRWQIIKTVITDTYADIINIDYDVDNLNKLFQQMMSYDYAKFSDIEDNFTKANSVINEVVYNPVSRPGGSGGSGSGSIVAAPGSEQLNEPVDANSFSDVSADFWGKAAISELSQKNVISGYPDGTFRPYGNVTRAEFVKMLSSAFGFNATAEIPFVDVNSNDWYYSYISAAYAKGVINGSGGGFFNPNSEITREDACVIIYRYLTGLGVLNATVASFADMAEFSDYASDSIATLAGNGIVNGVGENRFDAKASINRASCAVLILNCLNK